MKRIGVAAAGLLIGLGTAPEMVRAQRMHEPFLQPAEPTTPPLSSSTRRFVLRGFNLQDAGSLSLWLENMTSRLETRVGQPVPFNRSEIVRVVGAASGEGGPGRILRSQEFLGTSLLQRMTIENPESVSQETVLESLVQIHLNRYIISAWRRQNEERASMSLPDWFSVGIAQCLVSELLERNESFVRGMSGRPARSGPRPR